MAPHSVLTKGFPMVSCHRDYGIVQLTPIFKGLDQPPHTSVGVEDLGIGHAYSDVDVNLTVSVGLSTMYPQREASETELIRTADEALYQSKRNGRNTVSVRNEENRATSR